MQTHYDPTLGARVLRDDADKVRAIGHLDEYPEIDAGSAREAALDYLRGFAASLDLGGIDASRAGELVSFLDPEPQGEEFRLREEKKQFDTATVAFHQTFLNVPVWESGVTVTLKEAPWRALASTNTTASGIDAALPSDEAVEQFRALFETGEKLDQPQRGVLAARKSREKAAAARAVRDGINGASALLGDELPSTAARVDDRRRKGTGLIRGRFYIYRYDAGQRLDERAESPAIHSPKAATTRRKQDQRDQAGDDIPLCGTPPPFPGPIPPVADSIRDGGWYVVAELVFRRPLANGRRMNWRALVEVETGSILYLRALTSAVDGLVFEQDPITRSGNGTLTPNQPAATLDPSRVARTLNNLNAPVAGNQSLSGTRTFIAEMSPPAITAPTRPAGNNFDYGSRTNEFAAVNAYFHTDRFFALVENLGFPLSTFFNGTTFPIETDHRGMGTTINAQCIGDGDGIDYHEYALADTGDLGNPIGIATDWRVVLHELGGHGILYDHVNTANFGFSHSAGDSFAVILNDPASAWHAGAAIDRFVLAPFVPAIPRYSDRGVAEQSVASITVTNGGSGYTSSPTVTITGGGGTGATARQVFPSGGQISFIGVGRPGRHFTSAPTVTISGGGGSGATAVANLGTWGWGAGMDQRGYLSEEILSTTMFRVYRSLGGDASNLGRRQFAARATAYLILRAVSSLTPMSNPSTPALFLARLVSADAGDWTSEGLAGGAYNKVLTWAFEKQNLNGGARPAVDVYIDDGRGGEYPYQAVHWANGSVWNRNSADGMAAHQDAIVGVTNYAYCKVKNRGTSTANNVVVKGYHCLPSAGVTFPTDLQAMTTASISVGTLAPNNSEEKIVGPFSWTPNANAWGHDCMLMIASATGDPSNVDLLGPGESFADWRLIPNDNNIGQRNVTLVAAADGAEGIIASLEGKGFWVGNPNRKTARIAVSIKLPPSMERAGWRLTLDQIPDGGLRLKPGQRRLVTFSVHPGRGLARDALAGEQELDIVATATADGAIIGGMVYRLDPNLKVPASSRPKDCRGEECRDKAQELLECLDLPKARVKRARVRKVAIDLEIDDGCCD